MSEPRASVFAGLHRCVARARLGAIASLAIVAVPALAATPASVDAPARHAASSWRVQSWGQPAPAHRYIDRGGDWSACADGPGKPMFFDWRREAGGVDLVLGQSLQPGQAVRVTVMLKAADAPVEVDLLLRRDGAPYETAMVRTLRLTRGWQAFSMQGVYLAPDPGSPRLSVRAPRGGLCVGETVVESIAREQVGAPAQAPAIAPDFFGVHLNQLGRHAGWPAFKPGLVRLWDSGTTWADLQPAAEAPWSADRLARADYYLAHAKANDPKARLLFTLGFTPAWAARERDACAPSGYGLSSCRAPADLQAWRSYVRTLAQRYRGRITAWELWNEADMPFHWAEPAQALVPLARAAAEELKAVDPANRLIGPNITAAGMRFLNDFLHAGGGAWLDGLSVHAYFGRTPERSADQIRNVEELQRGWGLQLPVWNTEANVSCNASIEHCEGSGNAGLDARLAPELALVRGVLAQAAAGVRSIAYYTWEGASQNEGGAALVEADRRTPTAAGRAMQALAQALPPGTRVRSAAAGECPRPDRVSCVSLDGAGARLLVAWSTGAAVGVERGSWSQMRPLLGGPGWSAVPETLMLGPAPVVLKAAPKAAR